MEKSAIQQRMETFKAFGAALKGATVYYREDWGVLYFDVWVDDRASDGGDDHYLEKST